MRINRNNRLCCKKQKLKFIEDTFKSEICESCFEVVSYEKDEVYTQSKAKPEKKAQVEIKKTKRTSFTGLSFDLNTIYNEDCQKTMDRMKDGEVDYTFTSPPYNIGQGSFKKYKEYKDNLNQQQYLDWSIEIINSCLRVSKNHVFWNIQMLTDNKIALLSLQEHYKYKIKDILIWRKKSVAPALTKGVLNSQWEYIFVFSNHEPNLRRFKDGNFHGTLSNVIEVTRTRNEFADVHKATFPPDLPRTFISNFGVEGDIWYDPFTGTGTTQKQCILENRNFVGSEMSKEYFDITLKGLKDTYKLQKSQIGMFPDDNTKKVVTSKQLDLL